MKKVLKWIGILLAVLIGVVIIVIVAVFIVSNSRINASYDINVESVDIPTGEEALTRGEHVSIIRGCVECHKGDFGGAVFIDDPAIGTLNAANLTAGQGGIGSTYTDEDWVRSIRHGVGPDGKPLLFMPSYEFYYLSDEDLGALIAYLKSVRSVDRPVAENKVGLMGRILFLAGEFPLLPAETIDHNAPRPPAPEPGVTVEYGKYMSASCFGCHGPGFSGGPIPGGPPDWPPAANLTPGGNLANWTEEDFINTLRTGVTPEGHTLNSEAMSWPIIAQMTDEELQSLWLFLQSLPAKEAGNR